MNKSLGLQSAAVKRFKLIVSYPPGKPALRSRLLRWSVNSLQMRPKNTAVQHPGCHSSAAVATAAGTDHNMKKWLVRWLKTIQLNHINKTFVFTTLHVYKEPVYVSKYGNQNPTLNTKQTRIFVFPCKIKSIVISKNGLSGLFSMLYSSRLIQI